jgi:hypothetical protein
VPRALRGLPGFDIDPVTFSIPRAQRSITGMRVEQSLAPPAHHRRAVADQLHATSGRRCWSQLLATDQYWIVGWFVWASKVTAARPIALLAVHAPDDCSQTTNATERSAGSLSTSLENAAVP